MKHRTFLGVAIAAIAVTASVTAGLCRGLAETTDQPCCSLQGWRRHRCLCPGHFGRCRRCFGCACGRCEQARVWWAERCQCRCRRPSRWLHDDDDFRRVVPVVYHDPRHRRLTLWKALISWPRSGQLQTSLMVPVNSPYRNRSGRDRCGQGKPG